MRNILREKLKNLESSYDDVSANGKKKVSHFQSAVVYREIHIDFLRLGPKYDFQFFFMHQASGEFEI